MARRLKEESGGGLAGEPRAMTRGKRKELGLEFTLLETLGCDPHAWAEYIDQQSTKLEKEHAELARKCKEGVISREEAVKLMRELRHRMPKNDYKFRGDVVHILEGSSKGWSVYFPLLREIPKKLKTTKERQQEIFQNMRMKWYQEGHLIIVFDGDPRSIEYSIMSQCRLMAKRAHFDEVHRRGTVVYPTSWEMVMKPRELIRSDRFPATHRSFHGEGTLEDESLIYSDLPSDEELHLAVAILQDAFSFAPQKQYALAILIRRLQHMNDLHKFGVLSNIIESLFRPEEDLRVLAARALGLGSRGNKVIQAMLLEFQIVERLMDMTRMGSTREAINAVDALSAALLYHQEGQEHFCNFEGLFFLQEMMEKPSCDISVKRKLLRLVEDIAEQQLERFEPHKNLLETIVSFLMENDLKTLDYALNALLSLSISSQMVHSRVQEYCAIDCALHKSRQTLDTSLCLDELRDHAEYVDVTWQNVYARFSEKGM